MVRYNLETRHANETLTNHLKNTTLEEKQVRYGEYMKTELT